MPDEKKGEAKFHGFKSVMSTPVKLYFDPRAQCRSRSKVACLPDQAEMAPVLELLFDVFDRLLLQRPKVYSIGSQKGHLKVSFCEFREGKCKCMLYSLENWGHWSGSFLISLLCAVE